jgi:hypothetical protein
MAIIKWIDTPASNEWVPAHKAIDSHYDREPHEYGQNLHGVFIRLNPKTDEPPFVPWG